MLTKEDSELLTRIGPGAPMGELIRQYWIPVMRMSDLGEPDGAPTRVRLLGEDLIMFRDSSGQVGLLGNNCPHRGASLFFGRNEEEGIRCVYHGWKFDISGACVDMPNEPAESNFKHKVRATAYPCREYGGMVWTYMGPRSVPPELPQLEWANVPEDQRSLTPVLRECNWVQALEGDIDTAHLYFLHARLNPNEGRTPENDQGVFHEDRHPRLFLVDTPYGLMYGAQRDEGPTDYYWRITQFMYPFHTFFPPGGFAGVPGHIWVPVDDHNTIVWSVAWNPLVPLVQRTGQGATGVGFLPPTSDALGRWRANANKTNDYLIDRDAQRTKTFTGIPTIPMQDQAVTESMGEIMDRTAEHLGTTDATIIQVRRKLLKAAKALRDDGITPPGVDNPEFYAVRTASLVLPRTADWVAETQQILKAFTGLPVATA